jgi:lysophospholipase L1-like esterase
MNNVMRGVLKMNKIRIAAFGDAVTMGTSAKLDVFHDCFQYGTTTVNLVRETQTWRSIAARILMDWVEDGVEMINAGVSGEPSQKGLARLERDVLSQSPDIVLVMFGAEDALSGVEPAAFRENLKKIVDGIAALNVRSILMTPTPISERMTATGCTLEELRRRQERLSALAQAVRSLAEEKSLPLIDLHRYSLDTRLAYDHLYQGWLPDGVAQTGMASFVAGELLSILGVNDFPKPVLCDYRKAYSDAERPDTKHNGFTDIAFFQGELYVTFRTGHSHSRLRSGLSGSKAIVLRSADGVTWVKEIVLQLKGAEIRDPKFLQVDNRLVLYTPSGRVPRPPSSEDVLTTYGFERLGPGRWSEPFECGHCFFWRPRKWQGRYIVAPYVWPERDAAVKLLSSPDGRTWKIISTICDVASGACEADLWIEGDQLTAFSRADPKEGDRYMLVSRFIEPENRWETVSSGRIIQAPCVFEAGEMIMVSGRYCSHSDKRFKELQDDTRTFCQGTPEEAAKVDPARVEEYHHGLRTGVFVMDGTRPRLAMELLSAGDSSYTGAVQYGDETVISDYSMYEYYPEIKRPEDWRTPCDIYVSRIRFGG